MSAACNEDFQTGSLQSLRTRSLPTRCKSSGNMFSNGKLISLPANASLPSHAGTRYHSASVSQQGGSHVYRPSEREVPSEEDEEDMYGSSEDLGSGSDILGKLMAWAYLTEEG